MFMPQRKPTPWLVDLLERLAPYRPAPPLPGLLSEEVWRLPVRAADRDTGNPPPTVLAQAGRGDDHDNNLPDGVVNQFRDRLDPDGLKFLKHGPVTPEERRAYDQRVHPDAHLLAALAPAELQRRFRDTGNYDRVRYFVGPDDTLHVRDSSSREMLAQRLRRGLDRVVGGGTPPKPPLAVHRDSALDRDASLIELHRVSNRWPRLHRESERRQSILNDTPALIDVLGNTKAKSTAPIYALHDQGYNAVKAYDRIVEEEALRVGLDPSIARAIMYVENAQGWYGGMAELVGAANSLFPMNINPRLWGALGSESGELPDARSNIRAGVTLLKRIEERLDEPTIEKLATLYNNGAADFVSDYGARVAKVYRNEVWLITPQYMPGRGPVPDIP